MVQKLDYKWILGSTYIVIAQTDIEKGHKGINAFIVEKVGLDLILVQREMEYVVPIHSLLFNDVQKSSKENGIGSR
jgi:alkylation response protein AidB-like acyl-CoA dehydrogenase